MQYKIKAILLPRSTFFFLLLLQQAVPVEYYLKNQNKTIFFVL